MPRVNGAGRCTGVCEFRYAGDIRRGRGPRPARRRCTTSSSRALRLPLTSAAPPGPTGAQQGDRLLDAADVRRAVEAGLVSDHVDPERLRHAGDAGDARPRSGRPAPPSARAGASLRAPGSAASDRTAASAEAGFALKQSTISSGPSGTWWTSILPRRAALLRQRRGDAPRSARRTRARPRAAASALGICCAPCSASRTSARPHGDTRRKRGRRSRSSVTCSARTSASALVPYLSTGGALSDASSRGRARRRRSRPRGPTPAARRRALPWRAATPSRSPKYSTCAIATLVTTPTSGRATRASVSMSPTRRAPISTTTQRAASGALSSVSGRPSSLLKERSLAAVPKVDDRQAASRSLVVVLPTDPVTPIAPPTRLRASAPSRSSAAPVSPTRTAVPPADSRAVR